MKQVQPGKREKLKKSLTEAAEIADLERRIAEGTPPEHGKAFAGDKEKDISQARRFIDLPLSEGTKEGLKEAKYTHLTAIQRFALPQALCGRDVFGAAKTGSGKTLAFLIPIIEKLYRSRWSQLDGLGALVISPTRELALQIFNELRKIGKRHDFSAGLLIGGKNVKEEQGRVGSMNILICTPGRLLQHMDETPEFDSSNVQIFVLDEADRILDMGFSAAVDAIVQNLPAFRQTLLFSATQKQSVKQLARLSLRDPQYVSVHENAEAPTPAKLEQAYAICELHDKLSIVWSFIRSHLKAKILIFASTCKQVKFLFEAFSRLRPGCPLRCLHGGMKQMKRMAVFYDFSEATTGMVLFATDIAARGLDFAKLDWVLQMDCPEDVAAYIHRVGRTARYVSAGKGLVLLNASETAFLDQLKEANVPIKCTKINPKKTQPIQPALQALLSKNQALKDGAQRSMTAYLRSVFLAPNKAVFDVRKLPTEEYALSLGLSGAPKLRFIKKGSQAERMSSAQDLERGAVAAEENDLGREREGTDLSAGPPSGPESGEFLNLKPASMAGLIVAEPPEAEPPTKKRKRMKIVPGKATGSRVIFDEEGSVADPLAALASNVSRGDAEETHSLQQSAAERFKRAAAVLKARDVEDRKNYKERRRSKLAELKAKKRAREVGEDVGMAVNHAPGLGNPFSEDQAELYEDIAKMQHSDSEGRDEAGHAEAGSVDSRKQEPSHMGMATKTGSLTLADQEDLALRLLSQRHT